MNPFLVVANRTQVASEWLVDFNAVQVYMNQLQAEGEWCNVTVQKFNEGRLEKQFTYDFHPCHGWQKRKFK